MEDTMEQSKEIKLALVSLDMAMVHIKGAMAALNQNRTYPVDVEIAKEDSDGAIKFILTALEKLKDFEKIKENQ
jgi:hypothetical protein